MKKELKNLLDDCITSFSKESTQTQIFFPEHNGKKYFVKVSGPDRARFLLNEVNSLKKIRDISPFYKNYFIGCAKKDGKVGIMLKYVSGIDLQELLKSRKLKIDSIINLYKILLKKIKLFHNKYLNHGDIKPHNLYAYIKENGDIDIEYIDTESVNDFNEDLKYGEGYNNVITSKYDFPFKIRRSKIMFKNKENAFSFYKFLDIYSISIFIFYLYKKDIYKKLRNDTETPWIVKGVQNNPIDYIDKSKNKLEKALYYVFSHLKYLSGVEKTHDIKDIPISINDILNIID